MSSFGVMRRHIHKIGDGFLLHGTMSATVRDKAGEEIQEEIR
jgi:hypothetical protein